MPDCYYRRHRHRHRHSHTRDSEIQSVIPFRSPGPIRRLQNIVDLRAQVRESRILAIGLLERTHRLAFLNPLKPLPRILILHSRLQRTVGA